MCRRLFCRVRSVIAGPLTTFQNLLNWDPWQGQFRVSLNGPTPQYRSFVEPPCIISIDGDLLQAPVGCGTRTRRSYMSSLKSLGVDPQWASLVQCDDGLLWSILRCPFQRLAVVSQTEIPVWSFRWLLSGNATDVCHHKVGPASYQAQTVVSHYGVRPSHKRCFLICANLHTSRYGY
jgi:hypothetical protein